MTKKEIRDAKKRGKEELKAFRDADKDRRKVLRQNKDALDGEKTDLPKDGEEAKNGDEAENT